MKRYLSLLLVAVGFTLAPSAQTPPHHVVIGLAPDGAGTATVRDGSFSDPGTWEGGKLPATWATVEIKHKITLDGHFGPYRWVRVDQPFRSDPARDTSLEVDSLFVNLNGGSFDVACPEPGKSFELKITPYKGAPIDQAWDPTEISRGVVAEGPVTMCGTHKTPYAVLAAPVLKGSTTLQVEKIEGWNVGDEVVVTHLEFGFDESRTVTAANGSSVTLNAPLTFDHKPGADFRKLHVANKTRSVTVRSTAGTSSTLAGHFMLMGGGHTLKYVRFKDLGRTDLRLPTDPILRTETIDGLPTVVRDPQLLPLCGGEGENVRGRYSGPHAHMAGPASQLSVFEGLVVDVARDSGRRWGITNHSSNVAVRDSIVHNVSSGLVTEEGNEVGIWDRNLVIHAKGNDNPFAGQPGDNDCIRKAYPSVEATRRLTMNHTGACYWMQGGGVVMADNIGSGCTQGTNINTSLLSQRAKGTFVVKFPTALHWTYPDIAWANKDPEIKVTDVPTKVLRNYFNGGRKTERSKEACFFYNSHQLDSLRTYKGIPHSVHEGTMCMNYRHGIRSEYTGQLDMRGLKVDAGVYAGLKQTVALQVGSQSGNNHKVADGQFWGYLDNLMRMGRSPASCTNVTVDGKPASAVIDTATVPCK